jgi:hypothetical protein
MKHFCRIGGILIAMAGLIPAFMPDPSHPLSGQHDEVRDLNNIIIAVSCAALGYLVFRCGEHFKKSSRIDEHWN